MTTALSTVDFHGDKLQALDRDGKVLAAVRPLCDALGLGYSSQLQKLKSKAWATVTIIVTVADDGKPREMACLDVDSIPMWLAGIEPSKVSERARPKLVLFQLEAHRVLRDHFGRRRTDVPEPGPGTAPVQARLSDERRSANTLRGWVKTAAALTGRTNQSIQGELRKPWGVASLYRIPLVALEPTLFAIRQLLQEHASRKRLPSAPTKQAELPFPKPN